MSHYPTGIFGDGTSYNEFYPLPQWTQHTFRQLSPSYDYQQQYSHSALVPYTHQNTYTDVAFGPVGQFQPLVIHNAPEQPIRRKRASRPKVRTGCTTCKVCQVSFVSSSFAFFSTRASTVYVDLILHTACLPLWKLGMGPTSSRYVIDMPHSDCWPMLSTSPDTCSSFHFHQFVHIF